MNIEDLKYIIKILDINISKNRDKKILIKKILSPLQNKIYRMNDKSKRKQCQELAFKTILKNKRKNLRLLAGTSYYSDMWTRDAFITSLGLFAHKKHLKLVRQVLKVQAKNIRKDGLVPLRIGKEGYTTHLIRDDAIRIIENHNDQSSMFLNINFFSFLMLITK